MYTIKNGQFVYIDKNNGKYTPLSNDEAAYRIVECIVANYKHRVGPNYVVNDEEVVRMIPLVSENLGVISSGVLLQCLCLLIDSLSNYDPNANLESTYYVSRTIFRISQELIFKQNNAETIRLMVDFSKNMINKEKHLNDVKGEFITPIIGGAVVAVIILVICIVCGVVQDLGATIFFIVLGFFASFGWKITAGYRANFNDHIIVKIVIYLLRVIVSIIIGIPCFVYTLIKYVKGKEKNRRRLL